MTDGVVVLGTDPQGCEVLLEVLLVEGAEVSYREREEFDGVVGVEGARGLEEREVLDFFAFDGSGVREVPVVRAAGEFEEEDCLVGVVKRDAVRPPVAVAWVDV